ncbi:alpha/beta hydrolase family protein [Methylococcus geothermalis]|uniref:Alpha/beta hydrolase n=1 Tax=Methylococcus geothermalis TaxID=2681310 RepID=A0A858Q920_9GAMM|nr:hypothetical protein [Methylococcus geothermalis]QJD30313.1 hypothetical protein GNH96_10245 [Methylococcus geothermalis]
MSKPECRSARSSSIIYAIVLSALASCRMGPPSMPEPADPDEAGSILEEFEAEGRYHPERSYATTEIRESWKHGRAELDVAFTAPAGGARFPLVVYLPGLGEDATAGVFWRHRWAAAGYAVFAMQPSALAKVFWASDKLDAGELRATGRIYFSPASLESRLAHLAWALGELRQRAAVPGSPYAAADPGKAAVAGFDLGAQAASALAGEAVKAALPANAEFAFAGAVVLSPHVTLAEGKLDGRAAGMAMPLLAVTGTDDDDPYGMSATSLRSALWQSMPPGGKYLLVLQGGTHDELAGVTPGQTWKGPPSQPVPGEGPAGGGWMPWSREDLTLQVGQQSGTGRGRGSIAGGPPAGGREQLGGQMRKRGPDIRHWAEVAGVSTAFLDLVLKGRERAREWLSRDAGRWMAASAELRRK